MPKCQYMGCKNYLGKSNKNNNIENVSFHRLPKDISQKEIWFCKMGITELKIENGFICSDHFLPSDILKVNNFYHIKKNALPLQYVKELTTLNSIDNEFDYHSQSNAELFCFDNCEVQEEILETVDSHRQDHSYYAKQPIRNKKNIKKYKTSPHKHITIATLRRTIRTLRNNAIIRKKNEARKYGKFDNLLKLPKFIQEFVEVLLKHWNPKSTPAKYSPELREFALTVHYYSPAAYSYLRFVFNNCLPCDQSIRNWYRSIDGNPGFTNDSLLAIQNLQLSTSYQIVGCVSVDGMHLRKHLQNNGNSTFGYVDYGGVIPSDKRSLANESLTFMFTAINIPIKIQLGYFLINGIGAAQLTTLTEICVQLLRDTKVVVASISYDGLGGNFGMTKNLGCNWRDIENIKSTLDIDGSSDELFAWPDMPHMIKLFRNAFHDLGGFMNKFKERIEWKYIVRLYEFQNNLGVHFGNKLRRLHVNYKNQVMKVYLATQLISNSVADAIEICDKSFLLPDFRGSGATVDCLRIMNDIFDIFNSVDMKNSFYKQPLHSQNYDFIMSRLEQGRDFIMNLTEFDGTPMVCSSRNTGFVGILILINSLKGFYEEYVEEKKLLTFIPTYKNSQDNLEIFNSNMRSHSGYNTNPSPTQYRNAYKKSLLHVQFKAKNTGNCIALEDIPILHINSTSKPQPSINDFLVDLDNSELELDGMLTNVMDRHYLNENYLLEYINIIAYISGFVARRLCAVLKCETCVSSLITEETDDSEFLLILGKERGGLFFPSRSVREVCSVADMVFRDSLKSSGGKHLNVEYTIDKMTLITAQRFSEDKNLFIELEPHFQENPAELHYYILLKAIAALYLKVRVHYLNKVVSSNNGWRQKKTHEIHFLGV